MLTNEALEELLRSSDHPAKGSFDAEYAEIHYLHPIAKKATSGGVLQRAWHIICVIAEELGKHSHHAGDYPWL